MSVFSRGLVSTVISVLLILLEMVYLLILWVSSTYCLFSVSDAVLKENVYSLSCLLGWTYPWGDASRALADGMSWVDIWPVILILIWVWTCIIRSLCTMLIWYILRWLPDSKFQKFFDVFWWNFWRSPDLDNFPLWLIMTTRWLPVSNWVLSV